MTFAKIAVGGLLIGLGLGIWIGAAMIAGEDMDGMSVGPSLLLAMVGSATLSKEWRDEVPAVDSPSRTQRRLGGSRTLNQSPAAILVGMNDDTNKSRLLLALVLVAAAAVVVGVILYVAWLPAVIG